MSKRWVVERYKKRMPKFNNPVFIEGLPGIGNVGKIVADILIDELKAKELYGIYSHSFPHSVFVNEDNLVDLPKVEIFYKKFNNSKKRDLIIITGDVQPLEEDASYEFAELLLDMIVRDLGAKEIITLGGIGLQEIDLEPNVFVTGNDKKTVDFYTKGTKATNDIYGVVGPIIGVTGLLVGLAKLRDVPAVAILSETLATPQHLGINSASAILEIVNKKLKLKININKLNKEIEEVEAEFMKKAMELEHLQQGKGNGDKKPETTTYIG